MAESLPPSAVPLKSHSSDETPVSEINYRSNSQPDSKTSALSGSSDGNVPSGPAASAQPSRSQGIPDEHKSNETSNSSSFTGLLRTTSRRFEESNPPLGFMGATGSIASSVPSLSDIRRGSYGSEGWSGEGQLKEKTRRASLARRTSSQSGEMPSDPSTPRTPRATRSSNIDPQHQTVHESINENDQNKLETNTSERKAMATEEDQNHEDFPANAPSGRGGTSDSNVTPMATAMESTALDATEPFENGYQFPPKHSWGEATAIAAKGFWKFFTTPLGFFVTIYGLNVVAWGGMLFLLLCNASPAMCYPDCNNIDSPRRVWVEYDSQILTALFCVTAFGLIPWRFRDLWYLLKFRLAKKEMGLRRLAGIHRSWFRLDGSQNLPILLGPAEIEAEHESFPTKSLPFPLKSIADAPLTGIRAPPTAVWRLDFVIWMNCWNTLFQIVLCGFMWGMNRYDRPSWSTGLFVGAGMLVAALGGIMIFVEGKKVKRIEGIPVSEKDAERLQRDRAEGKLHWNNIDDKEPKENNKKSHLGHSRKADKDVELGEK